ncbi:T9SS type A sorting domain-containing protein [Bacteroidota bacterium]
MQTLIFYSLFLASSNQHSLQTLTIRSGTTPTIDGHFEMSEWSDADSVQIDLGNNRKVEVYYKYDHVNLYFVFNGIIGSNGMIRVFPEVCIDPLSNKGNTIQADDWWFHVSATDCEGHGETDVYNDCLEVQPDWIGVPNFKMNFEPDTIEMELPIIKLFGDLNHNKTIGLCFVLNNTVNFRKVWPQNADHLNPETWAVAEFEPQHSGLNDSPDYNFKVWPNPNRGIFSIRTCDECSNVRIYNILGETVYTTNSQNQGKALQTIDISSSGNGIYFLEVTSNGRKTLNKLIVY